ncbi:phage tail family protein [Macrococcoides goetzii]|uniref:Phage tail family protein n=1 Tax=Macrococcoides goetzii TaxID=1891097 RepID=A0A2G5NUY5_9STAP|nr:Ig-like domain-containing protein [Macrococcus goetzii]RAI79664.1 phage tail family protein [Macrococcus goetzii]
MHGFEISRGNTVIALEREGFIIDDIIVSTPEQENNFESSNGLMGRYLMNSSHTFTSIEVKLSYEGDYDLDFPLLRDKLYGLVSDTKPFYIRGKWAKAPNILPELPGETTGDMKFEAPEFESGKRFYVIRTGSSSIEKVALNGEGSITFETAALPYAESVWTTMDINNNGINYDGKWSYGMGLYFKGVDNFGNDKTYTWKYRHTTSPFTIFNAGDVAITSKRMYRKIKITLGQSTSKIQLKDDSGRIFEINRAMYSGDVILLDGPFITVNGMNAVHQTNRVFPYIYKGDNKFELIGATSFTVEFDFRYYYGSPDIERIQSSSSGTTVYRDITPPAPPSVDEINLGASKFTGISEEGATITVTYPDGTKLTTIGGLNGAFSVTNSKILTSGQNITFTATDTSGNISAVTTKTVRGFMYTAPIVQSFNKETMDMVITNIPSSLTGDSRYLMYKVYRGSNEVGSGFNSILSVPYTLNLRNISNYTPSNGDVVHLWIEGTGDEDLSPITKYTLNITEQTALNQWRSSYKDYSTTINSGGRKQITEILTVIGNPEQYVNVKTVGDDLIVNGGAGSQRYYELSGLKPNTTYTLSYNITWTDSTQGLHTHAWGIGLLSDSLKGTRRKFTFTTNAYGKFGYGNGATMDSIPSHYLNYMNEAVDNNIVTYSKITLNEGTVDMGHTAGTQTGV